MSFGRELEKRRRNMDLSLEEFSKETNISLKSLMAFERNHNLIAMTPEELWSISTVLDWPISDILETDDFKNLRERKNHGRDNP